MGKAYVWEDGRKSTLWLLNKSLLGKHLSRGAQVRGGRRIELKEKNSRGVRGARSEHPVSRVPRGGANKGSGSGGGVGKWRLRGAQDQQEKTSLKGVSEGSVSILVSKSSAWILWASSLLSLKWVQ